MSTETQNTFRNSMAHLCAVAVAAVFLYAAYFKIEEPRDFATAIRNYHVLPYQLVHLAALFLPWIEVGAAVALIIPPTRRAGGILVTGLCLMFIASVGYAMSQGYDIDCGCFGKKSAQAGLQTIALDVSLIIGTAIAVFLPSRNRSAAPESDYMPDGAAEQPA